jgi:hypothetical protein
MKLPHSWWHWFFTRHINTTYHGPMGCYREFVCTKCRCVFKVNYKNQMFKQVDL